MNKFKIVEFIGMIVIAFLPILAAVLYFMLNIPDAPSTPKQPEVENIDSNKTSTPVEFSKVEFVEVKKVDTPKVKKERVKKVDSTTTSKVKKETTEETKTDTTKSTILDK